MTTTIPPSQTTTGPVGLAGDAGPVVFTGTDPDSARPVGLTPAQVLLLRALHARAPRTITA